MNKLIKISILTILLLCYAFTLSLCGQTITTPIQERPLDENPDFAISLDTIHLVRGETYSYVLSYRLGMNGTTRNTVFLKTLEQVSIDIQIDILALANKTAELGIREANIDCVQSFTEKGKAKLLVSFPNLTQTQINSQLQDLSANLYAITLISTTDLKNGTLPVTPLTANGSAYIAQIPPDYSVYITIKVAGTPSTPLQTPIPTSNAEDIEAAPTDTNPFSITRNYVATIEPSIEMATLPESLVNTRATVQYFDDMGRPNQTNYRAITPSGKDLITIQEYDNFGRTTNEWLSGISAVGDGKYVTPSTITANAKSAAVHNDSKPYASHVYESSPLNRVLAKYEAGQDWYIDTHPIKYEYMGNLSGNDTLNCIRYSVSGSSSDTLYTLNRNGNYNSGELSVICVRDENGNASFEFKNAIGQTLLTRAIIRSGTQKNLHDTYFIYDDFGMLIVVLPPEAADALKNDTSWAASTDVLKNYAYAYKYDLRRRCIATKIPGCSWSYYVYDTADRLILSQNGEQRKKSEWSFSIYDGAGRISVTGTCKNTVNAFLNPYGGTVVKATRDNSTGIYKGYALSGITLLTPVILSANYYDDYGFMGVNGIPESTNSDLKFDQDGVFDKDYNGNYRDLLTGTLTAQLTSDGTVSSTYLYSVMYYDYRSRLIQTKSNNHLTGGIEKEYIAYNFTGQPIKKMHVHSATGKTTQTEVYAYTYDHAGRLLKITHQLNGGTTVTLAENSYDELGRLKTNIKGGQANLNTTYAYNVRSWITKISSPLFTQNLSYNTLLSGVTANAQWNGNISSMSWTVQGDTERKYGFVYDNLSRLKDANYVGAGSYTTNYTYDKHGNIKTLIQFGNKDSGNASTSYGLIDSLTMDHIGNQLTWMGDAGETVSISESADFKDKFTAKGTIEYTYNKNGTLYSDLNKGITEIRYNSLNLPQQMVINSSSVKAKNYYTYSASGVKLRTEQRYDPTLQLAPVGTTTPANDGFSYYKNTDYVGNIIYETEKKGDAITNKTRILVDGGYIEGGVYYFYLTDHLGNNRVVANASGTVVQKNHYYPFGTAFAEDTAEEQGKQPYKYNGKELDQMHGLNLYDYSARYYESAIGRFTTMDPLAEKYYSWSPYVYVGNNPLRRTDPTGMIWDDSKEAENLKKDIDKKITSLNKDIAKNQFKLDKGGLSEKQIAKLEGKISEANDRISNLTTSKGDIDKLGADKDNIYALSNISGGQHKVRQGSDGKVYIETSSNALSIHEITHVRQSLDAGGLKFSSSGELLNAGKGSRGVSRMEVEAYQMQYSFDKSFPGSTGGKGLQGIDIHSVGNIRDGGKLVYPVINQYSKDLIKFQKEQKKLLGIP